uniref:Uncharacterized protein n=1 Tax=Micrurus lemniscatus lemniscatus TaxID=129467 RepID=A0A2D4IIB5_MICLE
MCFRIKISKMPPETNFQAENITEKKFTRGNNCSNCKYCNCLLGTLRSLYSLQAENIVCKGVTDSVPKMISPTQGAPRKHLSAPIKESQGNILRLLPSESVKNSCLLTITGLPGWH